MRKSRFSFCWFALSIWVLLTLVVSGCGGTDDVNLHFLPGASMDPGNAGAAGQPGAGGSFDTSGSSGEAGAAGNNSLDGQSGSSGNAAAGSSGRGGFSGAAGGAGAAGSSGIAGSAGAASVVSVSLTPPLVTLAQGTSQQLKATAVLSDQSTMEVTTLATWASPSPTIASVKGGLVQAVAAGSVQITATYGGQVATATITVTKASAIKLSITPAVASVGMGGTKGLSATLFLNDGTTQDVSSSAMWSSSDITVASVNASGVVTGVKAGSVTVTAMAGGLSATATVSVSSAKLTAVVITPINPVVTVGVSIPFVATGSYDDGSISDVTSTVAWTSSQPSTLNIGANGAAKALSAGTSLVTATLNGVNGATIVTVTQSSIVSLLVTPANASLSVKGTVPLKATATLNDSTTLDVTSSVTWNSSSPGAAAVSNAVGSQGMVTGISAGDATIRAALSGIQGSASVHVTSATLAALSITPSSSTIAKGTTVSLSAKGLYSDGTSVDETLQVTWTSSDATVASISNALTSAGMVTGIAAGGPITITAAFGSVQATATINVTGAALTHVTVTPSTLSLPIGQRQNVTATAGYSDGTQVDVTTQAVWSTSDSNVVQASNALGAQGQVVATGDGSANIVATFQGIQGSAVVTVTMPNATQLVIGPIDPSLPVGQSQQFGATLIFNNGTQQNVTRQAMWASSNLAVATIGTGFLTVGRAIPVAPGQTTITASFNGLTATSTLTVTNAVITSISVSPIAPTYAVGLTVPFQATAIYSDGTSRNVTPQATWISSNPMVAGVTTGGPRGGPPGRVTTLAVGATSIQASYGGLTGMTALTVTSAVITSISVSPAEFTGSMGTQQIFRAQAIYSDGSSLDISGQATWTSDTPAVVGVNTAGALRGVAKALSMGTAHVQASYNGLTGSAIFNVTPATVQSISVGPIEPTTGVGVRFRLFATALLSDGSSEDITAQSTWTSSDPSSADVSDAFGTKGLVTPINPGSAMITATALGSSGSTTVTVKSAKLTTIQVTPFSPTLPVGYATSFQAVGIYDDNSTQVLTSSVTWTSSAGAVASVSDAPFSKGRVSPLSAGSAIISATYQGIMGTSVVTVSSATLQTITLAPATISLGVSQTLNLVATGDFGGGLVLDITSYVTWLSGARAVADVSNAPGSYGQVKALSSGMATISAGRDGKTALAIVTVHP